MHHKHNRRTPIKRIRGGLVNRHVFAEKEKLDDQQKVPARLKTGQQEIGFLWTPKPWKTKLLMPQNYGLSYKPKKW